MVSLSSRIAAVEYAIRDVDERSKRIRATGKRMYYLNIGDPNKYDFGAPPDIKHAFARAIIEGYDYYGDSQGDAELREEIASLEKVSPDDVVVTAGSSEGIFFLLGVLTEPGKNIVMPSPSYPPYISLVKFFGGEPRFVSCDNEWVPRIDDLRKKVDEDTRAIVVVNPNNPTGAVYGPSVMREISAIAAEYNIPIISDEIYSDLILDEEYTMGKVDPTIPHVIASGFSKIHLCTGYRLGYLVFKNAADIKDAVMKLCRLRLCVNTAAQRAGIAALRSGRAHITQAVVKMRKRRDLCYRLLTDIEGVSCVKPKAAFYAFPRVESKAWKSDKEFVEKLMEETGVVVVHGSGFSPVLDGLYFRVVYLPKEEELSEALGHVKAFIERHTKAFAPSKRRA